MEQQYKVLSATFFKSGQATGKDGNPRTWTMYSVTLEGYNGDVKGFDAVNPGDFVTLESKQNGQYTNTNYKAVKADAAQPAAQGQPTYVAPGAPAAAPSSSVERDARRSLELLVRMAEQMAIPAETIKEILEK